VIMIRGFVRQRSRLMLLALLFVAFPVTAHAHSPVKGMGDFINGLLHPLTTPAHLLIVLGLGLLAGRRSPMNLKTLMLVFMPLSAVALLFTTAGWIQSVYPPVLICLALCCGALLALDKTPSLLLMSVLFGVGAVAIGLDSRVESGTATGVFKMLLGTWLSLAVLVADIAIYVSLGRQANWLKVALRVLGSWIVAISLLMLAFSLRGT